MLQVRKLVLAVAAASALTSGMAHAVGLGNVSVKSSLNQPFEAEIELLETGSLTELELKSRLASPEDFSQAGIDRQFFLTNLKFTPVIRADGKNIIRVTSDRQVREPYLNFLVEVLWPNGRILREYTVLLDPPMYRPQEVVYAPSVPASEQPSTARQTDSTAAPAARERAQAPASAAAASTAAPTRSTPVRQRTVSPGQQHRVVKNDTLWDIASRVDTGASIHQTMLAIQDLNPQAFINGNVNRLKAGQVLTLPTEADLQKRSRAQALAEFRAKTAPSAAVAAQPQLDARQRTSAGAAPAEVSQQDSLRLVASETGQAATGSERGNSGSSSGDAAMAAELAEAKEALDSTRRENTDLREQLEELNAQMEKLQQLVELKNTQLASLQHLGEMAETGQQAAETDTADGAAVTEEVVDTTVADEGVADAVQPVMQSGDDAALDVAVADDAEVVEPEVLAGEAVSEEAASTGEPTVVVPEIEPVVASTPEPEPEPKPEPKPAPVVQQPVAEPALTEQPWFMPAVGGASIVLLGLLWLASRRKKKAAQDEESDAQAPALTDDALSASMATDAHAHSEQEQTGELPEVDLDAAFDNSFDTVDAVQDAPHIDVAAEESDNVIAEADNYITYGRFNQAADVLMQAIDKNPQRTDLRLKLLEVMADLEDKKGFSRQMEELAAMGVASATLDELRERYPHLAESAAVDFAEASLSLDELGLETPDFALDEQPPAQEQPEMLLDDGLDQLDSLLEQTPVSEPEQIADFSLDDLSLTLDDLPAVEAESASVSTGSDDEFALPELDELDELDSELLALDMPTTQEAVDEKPDFGMLEPESALPESTAEEDIGLSGNELDDLLLDFDMGGDSTASDLGETAELPVELDLSLTDDGVDASVVALEDGGLELDTSNLVSGLDDINSELDSFAASLQAEPDAKLEIAEESVADSRDELDLDMELLDTLDEDMLSGGASELDSLDFDFDPVATEPDEVSVPREPSVEQGDGTALEDILEGDDLGFLSGTDEIATKLDLAHAYVDMGDTEGARDILDEVLSEGSEEQQQLARELMQKLD